MIARRFAKIVVCSCCWALVACVPVRDSSVRVVDPSLHKLLRHYDARYDPAAGMLRVEFQSPGYHTAVTTGARVHPVRESLVYALALLQRDGRGDGDRAAKIVRKVLELQDTEPASDTYGIWPYVLEEPLARMSSPDLNWADFCGMSLAHILAAHGEQLPEDLQQEMRESVRHAATAIRRRDVGPQYTNIAVLGGGVCAVAGELLGDDELLAYARRRLQEVVEHTEETGGFTEYNSPPYGKVVIAECERVLQLTRDCDVRKASESLRRTAWKIAAESFHPATGQWAGPHARTSQIRLRASTVEFLSRRLPITIEPHPAMAGGEPRGYAVVRPLPCPDELVHHFRKGVDRPVERVRVFIPGTGAAAATIGTCWHAADACLGSVTRSSMWTQRKPLIAYWKTKNDSAVVFRARVIHDGQDFASMAIRTSQDRTRVLAAIHSLAGRGGWHRTLDRPPDGVFHLRDLRLRFELHGRGVHAEDLGEGRYALSAGERRMVIHTLPGHFQGRPLDWQLGSDSNHVYLDAIFYRGGRRPCDFSQPLDLQVLAGIELLSSGESDSVQGPQASTADESVTARWAPDEGKTLSVYTGDP